MIYKDDNSQYDLEDMPYNRHEDCLNCGQEHSNHFGWICYNTLGITDGFGDLSTNFSDYLPTDKYLTQSMKDSIISKSDYLISHYKFLSDLADKPAHQTAKPTIDQWQTWAHNQPGDCPCGIKREVCDYHR